jgi:hypothetical protein
MLLGGLGDLAVAVDNGGALAEGDRLARLALFLYFDASSVHLLFPLTRPNALRGTTNNISHDCGCLLDPENAFSGVETASL